MNALDRAKSAIRDPQSAIERMDFRNRIGLYGAYFFGMSGIGFTLPFLPLYLSQQGMSDAAIARWSTLAALASLAQFPVGIASDRLGRRKPFLAVALGVLALATWLLPHAGGAIGLGVLVVMFAENGICRALVESLAGAEAASLAPAGEVGTALGALRFFKPLGIIAVAVIGSITAERHGVGSILAWLAVVQTLAFVASLLIHDKTGPRSGKTGVRSQESEVEAPNLGGRRPATSSVDLGPGAWDLGPAPPIRNPFDWRLWVFVAAMILFHFGNAPAGVYLGLFLKRELAAPERLLSYCFVVSMMVWMLIARPAGRLADRWGRKPILIFAWMAMAVRLALLAVARNAWEVVAVQVLDGVASGLFSILCAAWVTDRLGDERRVSEAQVIVGTSLVLGSALGPALAAELVDFLGYRGLFALLSGAGFAATGLLVAFVPETLRTADALPTIDGGVEAIQEPLA